LVFLILSISLTSSAVYSQLAVRLSTGDTINYVPDSNTLTIYLTNRLCHDCTDEIVESKLIDSLVKYSKIKVEVVFVGGKEEKALLSEYKTLKKTIDKNNIYLFLEFKKETAFVLSPYLILNKKGKQYMMSYGKLYKTDKLDLSGLRRYLLE